MTGPELQSLRKRLGLTQPEFALAIGLKGKHRDRTIRRWEQGKKPIDLRTELAINQFANTQRTLK